MIRVVVVDDHHLVREGICKLLEEAGDIQVVGEADNGWDALQLLGILYPDVLVLDITMTQLNGLATLAQVKGFKTSPHVVILSMHDDASMVQEALQWGALGYVLRIG